MKKHLICVWENYISLPSHQRAYLAWKTLKSAHSKPSEDTCMAANKLWEIHPIWERSCTCKDIGKKKFKMYVSPELRHNFAMGSSGLKSIPGCFSKACHLKTGSIQRIHFGATPWIHSGNKPCTECSSSWLVKNRPHSPNLRAVP